MADLMRARSRRVRKLLWTGIGVRWWLGRQPSASLYGGPFEAGSNETADTSFAALRLSVICRARQAQQDIRRPPDRRIQFLPLQMQAGASPMTFSIPVHS